MLTWDDGAHALHVEAMDATHREFVALLGAAAAAPDATFAARFEALCDHTRRHFDDESAQMRACRFPAIAEHENEHRRVLGELAHLQRSVAAGRTAAARHYLREGVPGWFATHLATMDSCLAACLKRVEAPG